MKRLTIISLIFLAVGLSARGQDNPISEFDLYGCWVLEFIDDGIISNKKIFKSCSEANQKNTIFRSDFSLLAYNKSEFKVMSDHPMNCNGRMTDKVEGTWTFDKNTGIVELFYPENHQAEFWDKLKEDHPELKIPNPRPHKKFKIVGLDKNGLELEIIKTPHNNSNRCAIP